jgi:hypothetical protein
MLALDPAKQKIPIGELSMSRPEEFEGYEEN